MVIRLRSTWGWLTPLRCSFRSASCVMRRAKNAIRDTQYPIRYILLYNCKECSTNRPCFMQNKANFRKSQMDVNLSMTKYYEKKSNRTFGENKPNQSQSFNFAQDRFPIILESLNWLYIILFYVIVTSIIFMENL
jgi:hypothetical protein